jgi:hypothetical protein
MATGPARVPAPVLIQRQSRPADAVPGYAVKDLTIALENRPGALAEMGEALGQLILVVGDLARGREVATAWSRETQS